MDKDYPYLGVETSINEEGLIIIRLLLIVIIIITGKSLSILPKHSRTDNDIMGAIYDNQTNIIS